ncbi:MAG: hypothetical protein ACPG7F_07540 [Aggregatilineales bacterium]
MTKQKYSVGGKNRTSGRNSYTSYSPGGKNTSSSGKKYSSKPSNMILTIIMVIYLALLSISTFCTNILAIAIGTGAEQVIRIPVIGDMIGDVTTGFGSAATILGCTGIMIAIGMIVVIFLFMTQGNSAKTGGILALLAHIIYTGLVILFSGGASILVMIIIVDILLIAGLAMDR